MKVGIIGVGGMGASHNQALKALSEKTGIEVTAIADRTPEYLARAKELWPEAVLYEDGRELLEKEKLDCVHICTPSFLHADLTVAAMEAGMHVFVEKPVCLSAADCDRLLEVKKRTGVKVMVGQVVRFFPEYRFLKEAYDSGRYGKLKSLVMRRLSKNVRWGYENWFHDEKKSGSVILDLHIHDVDFMRYLLGEPEQFQVRATAYEGGMINQVVAEFDYPEQFVSIEGLWDVAPDLPFHPSFRAHFENATVIYDSKDKPAVKVWRNDGVTEEPEIVKESGVQCGIDLSSLGGYYTEIAYFYDCLAKGVEPEIASLEEGIGSVRLALRELEAAHAAVRA